MKVQSPVPPSTKLSMFPSELMPAVANGTILVVEDEAELAEILEYNLRKNDYAVHSAPDGLTACRMIAAYRPDLILLDVLLPDLDGWGILRQVRRHPDPVVAATPIIMMSALGSLDHRLMGLELGADAYLPKPYSVREVLLTARALIARARDSSRLAEQLAAHEASTRVQAELQGMLFHELRNQMVVVGGYARLLEKQEKRGAERSADYMAAIGRSSEHLTRIAEELMLTRSPSGHILSLASIDIERGIRDTAALLEPLARQKNARIEVSSQAAAVRANEAAFRLVLSNLLENALKYGPEGNLVQLRSKVQDGRVVVEVEDQGPGIPMDEVPRIFDKHFRGSAVTGEAKGTGLGLHVARTLAVAMNGELEVRSRPGEGSCFALRLPSAGTLDQ